MTENVMMNHYQSLTIALLEGRITPQEEQELAALRAEDNLAQEHFHAWDEAWQQQHISNDRVDTMWEQFLSRIEEQPDQKSVIIPIYRRPAFRWAAAIVLFLLISLPVAHSYRVFNGGSTVVEPAVSMICYQSHESIADLTLPDGSKVVLNAGSSLSYEPDFGQADRRVLLVGEAYFDVQKDTLHPFIVRADGLQIRVTGTRFNVAAYDENEQTTVTLLQGGVRVTNPLFNADLQPDEKLVYTRANKELVKRVCDAEASIAWIDGKMDYDQVRLEELLMRLSRLYKQPILLENEALRHQNVHYYMDEQYPLNDVLEALSEVYKLNIRHDAVGYHVTPL